MVPNRTNETGISKSEQQIFNDSYDIDYHVLTYQELGFDGVNLQRRIADATATKVTVVGSDTYVGIAAPGTAQGTAAWQCKKVHDDGAGTTTITWADTAKFSQISTDLTTLTYA